MPSFHLALDFFGGGGGVFLLLWLVGWLLLLLLLLLLFLSFFLFCFCCCFSTCKGPFPPYHSFQLLLNFLLVNSVTLQRLFSS